MLTNEDYTLLKAMQAHGCRLSKRDRALLREYDQASAAFWREFLTSAEVIQEVTALANWGRDFDLTKLFADKPTDSQSTD